PRRRRGAAGAGGDLLSQKPGPGREQGAPAPDPRIRARGDRSDRRGVDPEPSRSCAGGPAVIRSSRAPGAAAIGWDVERIRRDFPALRQEVHGKPLVYLDNAATSQKPQVVIDALTAYYAHDNANVHRGVHLLSERATEAYESARRRIQRHLSAASP